MNDSTIQKYWGMICQSCGELLGDSRFPLAGMETCLVSFNLTPLPPVNTAPLASIDLAPLEPAFRTLTEAVLLQLRQNCYTQTDLAITAVWAETLMRFCEVRFASLKKRALDKWKDRAAARLNMLHLAGFLMDYCVLAKDLRFLNTVLKLLDLKWVSDRRKLRTVLKKGGTISALFEFRALLMTEQILRQLEEGKWDE